GRWGYAYGTDLGEGGLAAVAEAARAAALVADPDPHAGLPDECGAADLGPLRSGELGSWSTDRKVELALAAERAARGHPEVTQVLADDGTLEDGLASAPFDGEGSPRRRLGVIQGGRLATFLFDARTARKAGRRTTASAERSSYRSPPSVGASNLVVEPGDAALEELVRRAGEGLYVTDVVGLHSGVNPVSGTFPVGATGILIANGELAEPVREITVASDLVTMLRSVAAV